MVVEDTPLSPLRSTSIRSHPHLSFWVLIALLVANVLWAGSYAVAKLGMASLPPITLAFLRFVVASLALMLPLLTRQRRHYKVSQRNLSIVLTVGIVGEALSYVLGYTGIHKTTASNAALIVATEPILTAMLSILLLHERVGAQRLFWLLIGLGGAYFVVTRGLPLDSLWQQSAVAGNGLVALSLMCEATYTVVGKGLMRTISPLVMTSYATWGSAIGLFPAMMWEQAHTRASHFLPTTLSGWLVVLYLGLGSTVAAYLLWNMVVQRVPASLAGAFLFIQPVLGAALGIVLLGDQLTTATIVGTLIIFISVAAIARGGQRTLAPRSGTA